MRNKQFWKRYRWISFKNLLIPAPMMPRTKRISIPVLQETTAIAITHQEVFGSVASPEDLTKLVKSISYPNWLLFLSKLAAAFAIRHSFDLQLELMQMVFPQSILDKILQLARTDDKLIPFNSWQIATLAKMALLESSEKESNPTEPIQRQEIISRCLLGVNDYISYEDFDARLADKSYPLLESLLRVYCFQHSENPKHVLSRSYDLFLKLPLTPQAQSFNNHVIIADLFQSLYNVPLELFLTLGFGVYSYYFSAWADHKPPTNDKVIINKETFFSKSKLKDPDSLLKHFVIDQNTFMINHRQKYGGSFGQLNDFNMFRTKPLLALNEKQYVAVNVQWLYEKLGEGIFWMISDSLPDNKNFRTFFGELYHLYFTNIFRRMFPDTLLQGRVFCDIYHNGKRSSDAIVYYPNQLVFFEAKWPTLRMEETMIPGSLKSFDKDTDDIIVRAASQLDQNIKDFMMGTLPLEGVDRSQIKSFYPVIVTARHFPIGPVITAYLLNRIRSKGLLCSPRIRKLEIITIEELEYLEPLVISGRTFPEIIDGKQTSQYFEHPLNWYIFKLNGSNFPSNDYLDKLFKELTDNFSANLF